MTMPTMPAGRMLTAISLVALVACAEDAANPVIPPPPGPPPPPTLAVRTASGSLDPDTDGYLIRLNGGTPFRIGPNDSEEFGVVPPGTYTATLEDLSPRCTIANGLARAVQVGITGDYTLRFSASCETRFHDVLAYSQMGQLHFIDLAGDLPGSPRLQRYESICALEECKDPVISTSGRLIAFSDRMRTYLARASTGSILASFQTDGEDYIAPLTWSPGDGHVAYTARVPGVWWRALYIRPVLNNGMGPALHLRHDNADASEPAWSPDGSWIAYVLHPAGQSSYRIRLVRPDGTGDHDLTGSDQGERYPTWSPDGSRLAYFAGNNIRVRTMASGEERELALTGNISGPIRFTPDGTGLIYRRFIGNCTLTLNRLELATELSTALQTAAPDCSGDGLPVSAVTWGTQ